jgi:hypothetical protein
MMHEAKREPLKMYQSAKHGSAAIGAIRGPIVQPAAVTVGRAVRAAETTVVRCSHCVPVALWAECRGRCRRCVLWRQTGTHVVCCMLARALLQVDSARVAAAHYI